VKEADGGLFCLDLDPYAMTKARRLVFTHGVGMTASDTDPTWQAIIENGFAQQPSARKDPKYVTHGLHQYKGKFYPQLAKGLMNLCVLPAGAAIIDPFCAAGLRFWKVIEWAPGPFGCVMNPLAPDCKSKQASLTLTRMWCEMRLERGRAE
jgi:hypothetical protein